MDNLKPCPFCGGEVTIAEGGYRQTRWMYVTRGNKENRCNCYVIMESKTYDFDSSEMEKAKIKADLIEAWNKRIYKKLSSNRGDSMTRNELFGALCFPEYSFLRENEHLGKHMMFVTVGGSHAYGTNVEGSDLDIRGVALNSKEDLLGLGEFEHYVDTQTDTTIYSFNKAVKLMCSGNPNMLEQLGNADELVISYNPMTQLLMDNKNLFLSKRVIYSFGGFAGKLIQKSDTLDKDPIYHNSKKMHKTVMNAVRVYLMLFDILEKGEIKTYRDNDHNFLTQLRNGEYDYKEIRQQLIPAYESRLSVDKSETYLPDNVDWKRVNELVMTVNEESLKI